MRQEGKANAERTQAPPAHLFRWLPIR